MSKVLPKIRQYPTEAQLWRRIKPKLLQGIDRAYRIEAIATPGFPDVIWCPSLRGPVFIELKAGPLRIREAQMKFAKDMQALDIIVWLIWQAHRKEEPMVWKFIDKITWQSRLLGLSPEELLAEIRNGPVPGQELDAWIGKMRGDTHD